MSPILQCEQLCLRRRGRDVLRDVSFTVDPGDWVALIGSNGSGKTSLLQTVLGRLHPHAGRVVLFNQPAIPPRRQRRLIGYVPQALAIDFKMPLSVRDVVFMGCLARRAPGRRFSAGDREAVDRALADTGLTALAQRPIGHLSGGELQKVHIARALCQSPRLLLLDEPTSHLDLGAQRDCLDLISRLHRDRELTTLIVMHDLKSLPAGCTRAMILDGGGLVYDGAFASVFTAANLAHIYKQQGPTVWSELLQEIPSAGGRP